MIIGGKKGNFSGFPNGVDEISFTITASQSGNSQFHAAADIDRVFTIKKPGKKLIMKKEEVIYVSSQRNKVQNKIPGISSEKADYLFSSDAYDSDGDGLTNLEERAFGGILWVMIQGLFAPRRFPKAIVKTIFLSLVIRTILIREMIVLNTLWKQVPISEHGVQAECHLTRMLALAVEWNA